MQGQKTSIANIELTDSDCCSYAWLLFYSYSYASTVTETSPKWFPLLLVVPVIHKKKSMNIFCLALSQHEKPMRSVRCTLDQIVAAGKFYDISIFFAIVFIGENTSQCFDGTATYSPLRLNQNLERCCADLSRHWHPSKTTKRAAKKKDHLVRGDQVSVNQI